MVQTLLNELSDVGADYPYNRDANNKTELKSKTVGDLIQMPYSIMHAAKEKFNDTADTAKNSQYLKALDSLYLLAGEIIEIQGLPPKYARVLKCDGKTTINISEPKYKYLKQHILDNEKIDPNFTIWASDATAADHWKFKRNKTNPDIITLPNLEQGDALLVNTDDGTAGNINNGGVGQHGHSVNITDVSKTINVPFNINASHSHHDNINYVGYIDSYSFYRHGGHIYDPKLTIDPNINIKAPVNLINNTNLVSGLFRFVKGASSLESPYNDKTKIHYNQIGESDAPAYGLHFDSNRSGAKSGGILSTNLTTTKHININSPQTISIENGYAAYNNNDIKNNVAGCYINIYITY